MKKKIVLLYREEKLEINLLEGEKIVDTLCIQEKKSVSREIFSALEDILKRNKLTLKDLQKVDFESEDSLSFTTPRIIKIVSEVLNWAKDF